jgi:Cu-processing system permease protein
MFSYPVISIAKKEIMDNIRNKWVILISILFAILTLLTSYAGSIISKGWQDFDVTITGMNIIVQILISIIALVLGYATIVGEINNGSMNALLSLPATRLEILIGKYIGLGCVLILTILIGFGLSGIVIGANIHNANFGEYFIFIGASILIGLVFLTIGVFISSLFKKRTTAMGGAVFVWFLYNPLIWGLIINLLLIITGSINLMDPSSLGVPEWYFVLQFLNPLSTYSDLVTINVASGAQNNQLLILSYPSYYTTEVLVAVLIIWLIVFLVLAFWRFRIRDV